MREKTSGAEQRVTFPIAEDGMSEMWVSALSMVRKAGRGMAVARNWIVDESMERHTAATLAAAFGVGVITGWLVKRR